MHLFDLIDPEELDKAIAAKHVKCSLHNTEPLAILNYTQSCTWDRAWTDTTRLCRGLIYRTDTMEIVARPFAKFFNYGEPEAREIDFGQPCDVTDKMDGSLGILYPLPVAGGYAIATRGAFHSEQAEHATAVWRERYGGSRHPRKGVTALFEIIYPENRIVLSYEGLDDLVLLALVDIATGRTLPNCFFYPYWDGRIVERMPYNMAFEVRTAPNRKNAEGMVLYFPFTGERVKIKQADYMALHRVITGTTVRRLWTFLAVNACKQHIDKPKFWASKLRIDPAEAMEVLAAGDDWQEKMLAGVPDEFFSWCREQIAWISREVELVRAEVCGDGALADARTLDRKSAALRVTSHPHKAAIFNALDGKEIDTYCWRIAQPLANRHYRPFSEDAA
jgi:RNA ligase